MNFNWWIRTFTIITIDKTKEMNLDFVRNVHGDEINMVNCRSIWKDKRNRYYRVKELNKPIKLNIRLYFL